MDLRNVGPEMDLILTCAFMSGQIIGLTKWKQKKTTQRLLEPFLTLDPPVEDAAKTMLYTGVF